jgi:hypothetical protein
MIRSRRLFGSEPGVCGQSALNFRKKTRPRRLQFHSTLWSIIPHPRGTFRRKLSRHMQTWWAPLPQILSHSPSLQDRRKPYLHISYLPNKRTTSRECHNVTPTFVSVSGEGWTVLFKSARRGKCQQRKTRHITS